MLPFWCTHLGRAAGTRRGGTASCTKDTKKFFPQSLKRVFCETLGRAQLLCESILAASSNLATNPSPAKGETAPQELKEPTCLLLRLGLNSSEGWSFNIFPSAALLHYQKVPRQTKRHFCNDKVTLEKHSLLFAA